MKIGVPIFGYQHFGNFAIDVADRGFFTANLGDSMQSIAIRLLLRRLGVGDTDVLSVNRDTLADYAGPPVALIMNGAFFPWSFPTPPQVTPVFIGLWTEESTIVRFRDYFSRFAPIGCRDTATRDAFTRHGVDAFVTGCLTLTIPPRPAPPARGRVLLVHGSGTGAFPASVLKHMPASLLDDVEFVYQRLPLSRHPLDDASCFDVETYACALLEHYASTARLVITPLHHAATPCIGLGIPVIVCRDVIDSRFSFLSELMPIHTPDTFSTIDWAPGAVNIDDHRQWLEHLVSTGINR